MCHSSGVKVGVGKLKVLVLYFGKKTFVIVQRVVDARYVEILGFLRRDFEIDRLERSDLWNELQKERQHSSSESRTPVSLAPLALIVCPREIVAKLPRLELRS